MPNFNPAALKKGKEAIREANEQRGSGEFRPFLPSIYWADDQDEHYVLILNPIDEIPRVEFHPYIEIEGDNFPHQVMARTDPSIGERNDPIQDQWKYKPRLTNLMIAVELEPTFKDVGGRQRPAGFEVATRDFERKVRDDDGNATDEVEEVTVPCVGLIAQSPFNFGNQLESYDNSEGPIHETALKIKRIGKKTNVTYQIVGYDGIDVDLTNLVELIDQVSYVEDSEELLSQIDGLSQNEAAAVIGNYLLYQKLNEFADPEVYDETLAQITQPSRYGEKESKKTKSSRKAKPSQRGRAEAESDSEDAPEETEAPVARRRKAAESTSQGTSAKERLEALRAKSKE
jgi:hypothetical protein